MPCRETVRIGLVATFGVIMCGAALLKFGVPAPKWWGCWLGGSELAWGAFSAIELLLGLVLLVVVRHPASWLAAVLLLFVSTAATSMLSYGGAASCGCMGSVDTPPAARERFGCSVPASSLVRMVLARCCLSWSFQDDPARLVGSAVAHLSIHVGIGMPSDRFSLCGRAAVTSRGLQGVGADPPTPVAEALVPPKNRYRSGRERAEDRIQRNAVLYRVGHRVPRQDIAVVDSAFSRFSRKCCLQAGSCDAAATC